MARQGRAKRAGRPRACRLAAACRIRRGVERVSGRRGEKGAKQGVALPACAVPVCRYARSCSIVVRPLPSPGVVRSAPTRGGAAGLCPAGVVQGSVAHGGWRRALAVDADTRAQAPRQWYGMPNTPGGDVRPSARPASPPAASLSGGHLVSGDTRHCLQVCAPYAQRRRPRPAPTTLRTVLRHGPESVGRSVTAALVFAPPRHRRSVGQPDRRPHRELTTRAPLTATEAVSRTVHMTPPFAN